jgi:imidazolonepropionase-like amidohydrolase
MVLTLDEKNNFYTNATVVIESGRFTQIIPHGKDFKSKTDDQVIDATGKLLMPALVDLHFHTAIAKVCSVSIVYGQNFKNFTGLERSSSSVGISR